MNSHAYQHSRRLPAIVIGIVSACTLSAALLGFARPAAAGVNMLAGGVNVHVPVASFKERRFSTVMKQRYDYSCGSAALASLLTFHYSDRVTEADVFQSMYDNGDQTKITREGFSLLDMKDYLDRRGYSADGYRVPLDTLVENKVPAVVLINQAGYTHFVVVKGVTVRQVLVGDPAVGIKVFSRAAFDEIWNGVVFVIRDHRTLAQDHFNRPKEWNMWASAPVGEALPTTSLASFSIHRPLRADF